MLEELRKYIRANMKSDRLFGAMKKSAMPILEDCEMAMCCAAPNINDFIDENKDKNQFQKVLFKFIDDRNLKDSDVYNKVNIDRRLFSKIRSDIDYHPSKETVILLGLSLELNEVEFEELLESAAYSLPKNNTYDLIIRFCFINKIYDLFQVNEFLDEYNLKAL